MSGSELAPIVMAVLRDKVVADQVEEIRLLREKLKVFNRIAITSSTGHVYVEAKMEDGYEVNSSKWNIDLTKMKPPPCSFRQFAMSEFHMNGIRLGEIARDCLDYYADTYLYDEGRGEIEIYFLSGIVVTVSIGPIALVDFQRLDDEPGNTDAELFVQMLSFAGGSAKGALGVVKSSAPSC
jgi:hypothetical protein